MDQQVVDQTFLPTATFPAALVNQMENIFRAEFTSLMRLREAPTVSCARRVMFLDRW
jgi:hypothetical protein